MRDRGSHPHPPSGVCTCCTPTVARDERGQHARNIARHTTNGEVCNLLLDPVNYMRVRLLRKCGRWVQQGGEGVAHLN